MTNYILSVNVGFQRFCGKFVQDERQITPNVISPSSVSAIVMETNLFHDLAKCCHFQQWFYQI